MTDNELMTIQELAIAFNVSDRTVRTWIAEIGLEPSELKLNTYGKPTGYYNRKSISDYKDSGLIEQLSEKSKLKFMVGHIELEGTEEQRTAIRHYVDQLQLQLQHKEALLLEEKQYNANVWEIAHKNNNTLIKQVRQDNAVQYERLFEETRRLRKQLGLDEFTGRKISG
jgi:hypothetical protein